MADVDSSPDVTPNANKEKEQTSNLTNNVENRTLTDSKDVPNVQFAISAASNLTNDRTEASQSDEKDAVGSSGDQVSEDGGEGSKVEAEATSSGAEGDNTEESAPVEDIEKDMLPVTEETIDHLTQGFLQAFVPHIETSYNSLDELMRNQRVLIETVQQENQKCDENTIVTELAETMTEARIYHSKLVNIKKEMTLLHERTTKIKKRSLKLQQQKMKENLSKEQQREKEMEHERHLIAKPASKRTEPATSSAKKSEQQGTATAGGSEKELPNKAI